ncbi:MAG TPA: 4-alpha-glucanotransferase, partial [Iamia sp.]
RVRAAARAAGIAPDDRRPWWTIVDLALSSPARLAVVPLQDVLGLGSDARMNTPGTDTGNWSWRATRRQLTPALARRLHHSIESSDRLPH